MDIRVLVVEAVAFVWNLYGVCMELLWNITVTTP